MISPRRYLDHAFSLIEILVVISIITLLLAVSLPAIRIAKSKARLMQCGVNLREIGVGLTIYAASANDILPTNAGENWESAWAVTGGVSIDPGFSDAWVAELQRILNRNQKPWLAPLRCPEAETCPPMPDSVIDVNERPGSAWLLNAYCRGRKLSSIPAASQAVLALESAVWSYISADTGCLELPLRPDCYPHPSVADSPVNSRWAWRFSGQQRNMLWCDGHVSTHPAAAWPDGDGAFDCDRIKYMRFNLSGRHPLDP